MKLKDVLFVIAIIVILYYSSGLLKSGSIEGFEGCNKKGPVFMSAHRTAAFLKADMDTYVSTMTPWDLYARQSSDVGEYIDTIFASATEFTPEQQDRFTKAAASADAFFLNNGHAVVASIPWVFAITKGKTYEDGLSHTRTNIIFVSDEIDETPDKLARTLVHEKLHLYQRANPEKMAHLLERMGYKRWKLRVYDLRIRANPDLDPWIYTDPLDNDKPMACYYSSDKPTSISDVTSSAVKEHPYERMAYEIAKRYNS